MKALLPIFIFLFSSAFSSPVDERAVCGDFVEGACDLSEYNIIDHNRYTDTPEQCQVVSMMQWFLYSCPESKLPCRSFFFSP